MLFMVLSLQEIIHIVVMSLALGFIFKDIFRAPVSSKGYDPLARYKGKKKVFSDDFLFAIAVTAPAIVLHEFGHKFVAMAFGYNATFIAAPFFGIPFGGVLLGVFLRLVGSPILFFIPAYVSILGNPPPLQGAIIAFSGPAVNLILWIGSYLAIRFIKKLKKKQLYYLILTKKINMLLFFFNMIPIGIFDGRKVLDGLIRAFM